MKHARRISRGTAPAPDVRLAGRGTTMRCLSGGLKALALLLSLSGLIAGQRLYAQRRSSGGLSGRVTDSKTKALPGVVVAAIAENGTVKFAVTDGGGRYAIPWLRAGRYTIWAGGAGFPLYENNHLDIRGDRSQTLDIRLQPNSGRTRAPFQMAALAQ